MKESERVSCRSESCTALTSAEDRRGVAELGEPPGQPRQRADAAPACSPAARRGGPGPFARQVRTWRLTAVLCPATIAPRVSSLPRRALCAPWRWGSWRGRRSRVLVVGRGQVVEPDGGVRLGIGRGEPHVALASRPQVAHRWSDGGESCKRDTSSAEGLRDNRPYCGHPLRRPALTPPLPA
jgi:hypothetical protein